MDATPDNTCMNNLCSTREGLRGCTRCKIYSYCSKDCQVQHWKRHKKFCKMISSSPEMRLKYVTALEVFKAANNQSDNGDYDQALLSFQKSLEIFQEFQDDVLISECYIEIGRVLNSQNKYEEALVNFRKALEINKEINGDNHARTCDCYEAIGSVLGAQGRYDDALIGYGKALAIRMKVFGEHHENTAHSYFNIGLVMKKKADTVQALTYFQKANAIYARELGAEDPRQLLF